MYVCVHADHLSPTVVSGAVESGRGSRGPETILPRDVLQPICVCRGWRELLCPAAFFTSVGPVCFYYSWINILCVSPFYCRPKWGISTSQALPLRWRTRVWSASPCSIIWSQLGYALQHTHTHTHKHMFTQLYSALVHPPTHTLLGF